MIINKILWGYWWPVDLIIALQSNSIMGRYGWKSEMLDNFSENSSLLKFNEICEMPIHALTKTGFYYGYAGLTNFSEFPM